jgi:hypothetical protein
LSDAVYEYHVQCNDHSILHLRHPDVVRNTAIYEALKGPFENSGALPESLSMFASFSENEGPSFDMAHRSASARLTRACHVAFTRTPDRSFPFLSPVVLMHGG